MKAVLLHSGGLDSTVLLYDLIAHGIEVLPLSISYGQRHVREIAAAKAFWDHFGLRGVHVDLSSLSAVMSGSVLTEPGAQIPHGHYEDPVMTATVVPNRNMVLLSCAVALAISRRIGSVYFAAHDGDRAIYHDCRQEFVFALRSAIALCAADPPSLLSPYLSYSKTMIVEAGVRLNVPLEKTWSCYEGGRLHCGKCGACNERREAFSRANVSDPTDYED